MAFSPSGTLYTDAFGTNNDLLYSVNTTTGVGTAIGSGLGAEVFAGVFVNGTLFGFGPNPNLGGIGGEVYTINTSTGVATAYGSYSFGANNTDYITAAAILPASVPEPSTLALGGIAAITVSLALVVARTRQKQSPNTKIQG